MAAEALEGETTFQHNIGHDLESLFYVALYCSIRWLPVKPLIEIGKFMQVFFDASSMKAGEIVGGDYKMLYLLDQKFSKNFVFVNKAIQEFFKAGYAYLKSIIEEDKTKEKKWDFAKPRELFQAVRKGDLGKADRVEIVDKIFHDNANAPLANEPTRISSSNWASSQYSIKREADDELDDNSPRMIKRSRGGK